MVKLEEHKQYTEYYKIEEMPQPGEVYIPLSQHIGRLPVLKVKAADEVFLGQEIASAEAAVSSSIHSSVSGKVKEIRNWPHPAQGLCQTIVIENDRKDKTVSKNILSSAGIGKLTRDEILSIIRKSGIVGMGGAGFPAQIKLAPPKPVDSIILNGAECEPYLTSDCRLMVEKTEEIFKGIDLIVRCVGVKNVFIAVEDNKPDAIKAFENLLLNNSRTDGVVIKLIVLKSAYPQGGEKQLIKSVLKREIPAGKLPFDAGVLVNNVGTVFAVYEAVYKNKPLYERVVTVTGDCLTNPKNLLVRIGTPIKELIEFCQPLKKNPVKILMGGPMMGIAQYTQLVPVTKTSSGVVLISDAKVELYKEEACIRCGECVRNCPIGLQPCMISMAVERKNWELVKVYSPLDCIECGICAYLCPAKRNIVQSVKLAKQEAK